MSYRTNRGFLKAVDNVSFDLKEGESLGIVGESGSGKSSLALSLVRLLPPNTATQEGRVILDGAEISSFDDERFKKEIRWKAISLVFQGALNSFNPVLKVGVQVEEPMRYADSRQPQPIRRTVEDLFKQLGLSSSIYDRYPHELSGGMKQRAAIAMALTLQPKLIILDEPTSALDVSIQAQVMNLMKKLKAEKRLTILFITHDIGLVSDLCDKVAVMYAGQLVESGPADTVLRNPKHPYTKLLLASYPSITSDTIPKFIPGAPPDLIGPPRGCRFHPRCPYAFEKCVETDPSPFLTDSSLAKCWLLSEKS
jgi:peptide/nickel transport system ATP-binding protein